MFSCIKYRLTLFSVWFYLCCDHTCSNSEAHIHNSEKKLKNTNCCWIISQNSFLLWTIIGVEKHISSDSNCKWKGSSQAWAQAKLRLSYCPATGRTFLQPWASDSTPSQRVGGSSLPDMPPWPFKNFNSRNFVSFCNW